MELWRHSFPNWFVWLLIAAPIAMVITRYFREMERKSRKINEADEVEIERREAAKQAHEAYERERTKIRRLHKLGWRTAEIANELQVSTARVRLDIRSEDSLDISMRGALVTMRELRDIASHAKAWLHEQDRPIVQSDVDELLGMLADAQQRIDAEIDSIAAKFYNTFYGEFFALKDEHIKIEAANSLPQEIIDLAVAAANNGVKGPKLYELIVAEIDVGVARFYVTLNTVLAFNTKREGWKAPAWMLTDV